MPCLIIALGKMPFVLAGNNVEQKIKEKLELYKGAMSDVKVIQ